MRSTYAQRAEKHASAVARRLLALMESKRTNLAVSVDVTTKAALLRIVDAVGPYCCMIKTHIDIVEDFDEDLTRQLVALSERHDFVIFEDRKFADIGNTVKLQYSSGVYKIASWAHIVNAHAVPGDGIVEGLAAVGLPLGRGLLLLAEMSSKGHLCTPAYAAETVAMARRHREFVFGFIAQHRVQDDQASASATSSDEEDDLLILAPGIGLDSRGDATGQQYRTPAEAVGSGADVCIVGRGIYGSGSGRPTEEIVREAKRYRDAGWAAYEQRVQ